MRIPLYYGAQGARSYCRRALNLRERIKSKKKKSRVALLAIFNYPSFHLISPFCPVKKKSRAPRAPAFSISATPKIVIQWTHLLPPAGFQ